MTHNDIAPMPDMFAALGDPTRFAIVEQLLAKGEQKVGDLQAPFSMSAPAFSRHIKVLEQAGLIERRAEKNWRYCSLRQDRFQQLDTWLQRYRKLWNARFDRLDQMLRDQASADHTARPERTDKDG